MIGDCQGTNPKNFNLKYAFRSRQYTYSERGDKKNLWEILKNRIASDVLFSFFCSTQIELHDIAVWRMGRSD